MTNVDARFEGSVPELYDQHLGPLLFVPYADELAARLADVRGGRLLETAAGTGIVTTAVARGLADGARLVATDLNPGMLEVARRRVQHPAVSFQVVDAQSLPFEDASFDAVYCQFGVMFFPDRIKGFREARRVLAAGGRYVFSVWGSLEANEATLVVGQCVAKLFPDDPPRFLERTPFGYFEPARIRADLASAGFSNVTIDHVDIETTAPSAEIVAMGICKGTPLRNEIEQRAKERLEEVTESSRRALVARFGSGAFANRMRAVVVTASG